MLKNWYDFFQLILIPIHLCCPIDVTATDKIDQGEFGFNNTNKAISLNIAKKCS